MRKTEIMLTELEIRKGGDGVVWNQRIIFKMTNQKGSI